MKNDNVTIYDIAREAGVSPATVSRIINGTANVKAEKRVKARQSACCFLIYVTLFIPLYILGLKQRL
jgi:transcriptional regulator with XRE-family HTH domain